MALELEPNHASLHDGRIIHGSQPNTSSLRRCGYTMRYMPTSVKLSETAQQYQHIYLARGRDLAGNPYADPAKADPAKMSYRIKHGKSGH